MKSRLVIILFAIVCTWVVCNHAQWKENNFYYDSDGYYKYLPALFVNHDLRHVYEDEEHKAKNIVDKYPLGVALFELPAFLVAHGYCSATKAYPQNGYSEPYQVAGLASTILWVILGLVLLRLTLRRYFSDTVIAIVLACIAFGTNLYTYTVFDPGMSHPFSFFLFSAILYTTIRFYEARQPRHIVITAALVGWAVITRPVNGIVVLIPLLWQVDSLAALRQRVQQLLRLWPALIIAAVAFGAVVAIQLSWWKYATGHWLYYSYGNEGFNFLHPHILKGLFSYRKGWFVYTPVASLAIIGFFFMWKKNRATVPALLVFLAIGIYITFSWKCWWYGGSFGCRPLIEYQALLALPLGYLISAALDSRVRIAVIALLALCITLNLFQSYQYSLKIIHYDRMSRTYYWKVFGKTHIDFAAYEQYLMDEKEYWREVNETIGIK